MLQNPFCSLRNKQSTASLSLLRITVKKNPFLRIHNRVIPSQLLQLDKLPFLGSFTMAPSLKSCGTCSSFQQRWISLVSICTMICPQCSSISAEISSVLAVLHCLYIVASATSSSLISSTSTVSTCSSIFKSYNVAEL